MEPGVCGAPVTGGEPPTTSDALGVLRAATALDECRGCECDVDGSGRVSVTDALIVLRASILDRIGLSCPGC